MGFVRYNTHKHVVCTFMAAVLITLFLAIWIFPGLLHGTALIWQNTFMSQFFVWNLITGNLVETSLVKLLISIAGIYSLGPTVEEALTPLGTIIYLLLVAVACGVFTSMGIFTLYIITRFEYLLSMEVHGSFGLLCALLVAVIQHLPELLIFPPSTGMPPIKLQILPLCILIGLAISYLAGFVYLAIDFPFVCVGTFVGWALLRFYRPNPDGTYGDVTEHFQAVMFLPPVCRGVVKPFSDFVYGVMLLLGCFKDRKSRLPTGLSGYAGSAGGTDGIGGLGGLGSITGLSGSGEPLLLQTKPLDPVTERRRARAMKLLDEKFEKLTSGAKATTSTSTLNSVISSASATGTAAPPIPRGDEEVGHGVGGDLLEGDPSRRLPMRSPGVPSPGGGGGGNGSSTSSKVGSGGAGGASTLGSGELASGGTKSPPSARAKGRRSLSPVVLPIDEGDGGGGRGSSSSSGGGGGVPEAKGKYAD